MILKIISKIVTGEKHDKVFCLNKTEVYVFIIYQILDNIFNKYEKDYFFEWHITRVEDIEKYCRDGILTLNDNFDKGVKRLG